MSDKKPEGEGEAKHAEGKAEEAHGGGGGGGIKALLPLIIMVVLMPVLAFTTTQFLVIPKVVAARGGADAHAADAGEHGDAPAADGHGEKPADKGHGDEKKDAGAHGKDAKDAGAHGKPADAKGGQGGGGGGGKKKQSVPISKVIVNVAGSSGSRYLMTSFTLAGTNPDFKTLIEENKDQLLDLANTSLASKTINDLEKPGARNLIRAELISIFNNALGGGTVQEIYFTEFAVQ
jgi:flagellar protein FliL